MTDCWSSNQLMNKLLHGVAVFLVYVNLINEYMLNLIIIATCVHSVRLNLHVYLTFELTLTDPGYRFSLP